MKTIKLDRYGYNIMLSSQTDIHIHSNRLHLFGQSFTHATSFLSSDCLTMPQASVGKKN